MIRFNSIVLDDIGRVSLKRLNRTPDPLENPSHWIETTDLGITLSDPSSSAVWARIQQLQGALAPEGLLEILDGSGALTERRVSVLSNNVEDVIRAHRGVISVSLRAVVPIDAEAYDTTQAATWRSGDATAILRHVRQYREDISTETFSPEQPDRLRTTVITSFTARAFSAVPEEDRATRQVALMTVKEAMVLALHRNSQGTLTYAGNAATMSLVSVTPSIDDHAQHLDVQLQFRREIFPGGGQVRYDYTTLESSDCTSGKVTLSVEGKLLAPTRSEALTAIETIKEKHQTGSNKQTRAEVRDRWVRAGGATQDKWVELSFTLVWEAQDDSLTFFDLRISTDVDHERGEHRTTYSGTVTASDEDVARAKARELGRGRHPVIRSENEESIQSTDCDGVAKFESLSFSYVYATESDSAILSGSVTLQYQKPLLGEETTVISGQITASSYGAARALALTMLSSANHLADSSETQTLEISADGQQWKRLDFSYTLAQVRSRDVAMRFTRESSTNFEELIESISLNGVIRAKTSADARAAIDSLILEEGLKPVEQVISDDLEESAGHTRLYRGTNFRLRFEKDMTADPSINVLQASLTVTEVPQEAQDAITQVPFGLPVTQRAVTWNIGELSISGSVRARTQEKAREWALSKRALVASRDGIYGSPSPARISTRHYFKRYATDLPTSYEVQFQFGFRYGRNASGGAVVTL